MNCDGISKLIPLYHYGELSPAEEELVEQHVDACPGCRQQLERHQAMIAALDGRRMEPDAELIAECRRNLLDAVDRERAPVGRREARRAWPLFREGLALLSAPLGRLRAPLGAVALLALGYFSGRLTTVGPSALAPAVGAPETVYSAVRSIQPDASGRVRIALDETRRQVISGSPDEGRIQRLLLAAARDESNPGVRVESVDILKNHPASAEIRGALLSAVARDPNPGVRLKALEGLKAFASDQQVRKTLAQALLNDDNPAVRIQAIDMLIQHRDDSMVGVLQNLVQRENNEYVRSRCERMLKEMNASVGTF